MRAMEIVASGHTYEQAIDNATQAMLPNINKDQAVDKNLQKATKDEVKEQMWRAFMEFKDPNTGSVSALFDYHALKNKVAMPFMKSQRVTDLYGARLRA